uniref:Uncharacterized protein n=1 Tax=Anguilla anguilla TaxID=7936 RepID=A0A0E9UVG5_ANGAN
MQMIYMATFNCLCCKIHTHILFQRTNEL